MRRPHRGKRPIFLRARWVSVLIASWPVDPRLLMPHLPLGTELDIRDGRAFVSVVAFLFRNLRACGIPILGHRAFGEINLRFYVRRHEPAADGVEVRPGVAFLREYVPSRLIAAAARWSYREPYRCLPIRIDQQGPGAETQLRLVWGTPPSEHGIAFAVGEPFTPPAPGSTDQFLTDRFWGYTRWSDAITCEYHVQHPAWRIARPRSLELNFDPTLLFGEGWGDALSGPPAHCVVADGSPVAISLPRRITAPIFDDLPVGAEATSPVPA